MWSLHVNKLFDFKMNPEFVEHVLSDRLLLEKENRVSFVFVFLHFQYPYFAFPHAEVLLADGKSQLST